MRHTADSYDLGKRIHEEAYQVQPTEEKSTDAAHRTQEDLLLAVATAVLEAGDPHLADYIMDCRRSNKREG